MTPPTAPQLRSLYRRLLRELPSRPSSTTSGSARTRHQTSLILSTPTPLQQRIRHTFSTPRTNTKAQLEQAEEFVKYVQAQRMYATLIERYNPGMGMTEEERVRLTARRVGMDMPEEWYGPK
ncbi:hypothetical protein P154DRAFT_617517 [Amniculicola lignicola CBS 123094]|uniref:Ras guanyl-nucleotide exchange factor RasGEF n=1 Tax=Amniculicola lignicola CBS 123094 TaxID=1392246 RepID=A0A6A5WS38_9PLEO|nr:hypothetical protein P154DRAFT_617517 [Amniculicola lignicola CBS 123094]